MDEIVLSPFSDLLGIAITQTREGGAVLEMQTDARMRNRFGTIHGGALFTLADAAMGAAVKTLAGRGASVVTRNASIDFIAAANGPVLVCSAEVKVREGRHCRVAAVVCDEGRTVAKAKSDYVVIQE